MKLYLMKTKKGEYYTLANHPTEAEDKLKAYFDKCKYSYYKDTFASIEYLAESTDEEEFLSSYNLVM